MPRSQSAHRFRVDRIPARYLAASQTLSLAAFKPAQDDASA